MTLIEGSFPNLDIASDDIGFERNDVAYGRWGFIDELIGL